jgi:15-hydroxyprostaglandin dehydrogenase (NAD)
MELAGRVAVVTGAASGIGRAIALALAAEGARVVVADVDETGGAETVRFVRNAGSDAAFLRVDVTVEVDVAGMLHFAQARFGGLDVLCNNAGVGEVPDALLGDRSDAWRKIMDVNLGAVILGTRLGVRALKARGGGVIVNTASMGGLRPMPNAPVYAATKAGVIHLCRSLAHLKDEANVRVNAICPSFVDTPMLREFESEQSEAMYAAVGVLTPEKIAEGVLELIHDDTRAGAVMRVTAARGIDYAREIPA